MHPLSSPVDDGTYRTPRSSFDFLRQGFPFMSICASPVESCALIHVCLGNILRPCLPQAPEKAANLAAGCGRTWDTKCPGQCRMAPLANDGRTHISTSILICYQDIQQTDTSPHARSPNLSLLLWSVFREIVAARCNTPCTSSLSFGVHPSH